MLISIERYHKIFLAILRCNDVTKRRFVVAALVAWSVSVSPSLFSTRMNSSVFFVICRVLSLLVSTHLLPLRCLSRSSQADTKTVRLGKFLLKPKTFLGENKALKTTVFVIGAFLATCTPIILVRRVSS